MIKAPTSLPLTILTTIIILSVIPPSHILIAPVTAYTLSPEERSEIYRQFDVDLDEAPECPTGDDDLLFNLCPIDDGSISVGRIEGINEFCNNNVPQSSLQGGRSRALEGCKRFVACYIVRNKQKIPISYACCPSEKCNLFLGEQYVKMGVLWDDDDDDQFPDEDDDRYDDGVLAREEAAVLTDL